MTTWRDFWDSAHSIYVSDRHKDVHYRDVAERLAAFVPRPDARVLDYGSGEAVHAGIVANRAREVLLCDAAASVRAARWSPSAPRGLTPSRRSRWWRVASTRSTM